MKTRSKLLLAAVSLLTVSVAATATSAYAWYTANRQVSANLTQMGVQATSGTLSIEHNTTVGDSFTKEGEVTMASGTYDLKASASNKALTDVSSNGDGTFIKPKFSHDNTTIVGEYTQSKETAIGQKTVTLSNGVSGTPTPAAITAYGVISLAITISNSAASGAGSIDVYIDPTGTTLTSTLASAKDSARFSIIEVGSSNSVYMYCSPTAAAETKYEYLTRIQGENNAVSFEKTTLTDDGAENNKLIQDKADGKLFKKESVPSPATHTKSDGYLCTLDTSTNKSKTFLITMWVEGTDKDCNVASNTSISTSTLISDLSLKLGLYALEA